MLRNKINHFLSEVIPKESKVALLFSGGLDSQTCLYSLLDIGITPKLYTFHLDGENNKDLIESLRIARELNLEIETITIKKNISDLISDIKYITQELGYDRKTNVQCTYPFLHVLPKISEEIIISGLGADDLLGSSKSMSINYSKDKIGFTEKRMSVIRNPLSSAIEPIQKIAMNYNKKLVLPYRNKEVMNYLLTLSWEDINKPKQKNVTYEAYKEEIIRLSSYRRNSNLQVDSKIREWHNELLNTELNYNNRKRVDEIYKDLKGRTKQ